ncbi:hypothetical protein BCR32DRAFT_271192 [Anaeromyces robustus]|uniref:Uncharacterized protein n=1 Tax=Anaeromyces robustus TaxID=1754192 RepID=A0A1Y1WSR6_9FUNG|nr:hypothetical protein BCR32DRAFT_271192 [Anaeromyces robustus]|eukprot:ORX76567.1 hypothetical protein BCR32DRAFT_271192 [Anaeromyces robustus]
MSSKIRNHSKNDINAIVYSTFMIIWFLIVSILAKYFGILPIINSTIWGTSIIGVLLLVKTIIGIYYRNLFYITDFKTFLSTWILQACGYGFTFFNIINFIYIWNEKTLDKFRKITDKNIENYSNEELKKIIILNSSIMVITGILYIIILKIFTSNYDKYLDNVNSDNNYRKYSWDEKKATNTSNKMIWWLLFISTEIIFFVYITRKYINGIHSFIIFNSIYGIISLLLVNIGIHKRNISLIKNYKKIPWNQSLIGAYILCMILYIIKFLFGKNEIVDKKFNNDYLEKELTTEVIMIFRVLSNILGIIHLYFLKKFPSHLDKCTNNIVEKIICNP